LLFERVKTMDPTTTSTTTDGITMTIVQTGKGQINVIHEITLGDVLTSTVLMAILIFMVLDRQIRR
jgi:hypothetical protein